MTSLGLVVGPMVLFAGAVLVVGIAAEYARRRNHVATLEPVDARIVSSEVGESISLASVPHTVCTAEVTFQYAYGGETHASDRLYPSRLDRRIGNAWAEDVVASYPEGDTVTAHVDPDRPDEAVLRTEPNPTTYALLSLTGVFLLGLGAAMLVL